jgi:Transglutaminase-like superfamily
MNRAILVVLTGAYGCLWAAGLLAQPSAPAAKQKTRSFQFVYAGRVTDLKPGTSARVWLPLAASNGQQEVTVASQKIAGDVQIAKDKGYGNSILYFEGTANDKGEIPFEVTCKVTRQEVKTDVKGNVYIQAAPGEKVDRYLQPDAKVPIAGKPLELLKENLKGNPLPMDPFAAARVLYEVVNKHMTYKKVGAGWGQGDSLWACDSKYGNCTDFHSLFISMARGNKIASKFEMGFSVPTKPSAGAVPGYHCWAWFLVEGKGWIPVDISEANQHPQLTDYYFGNLSENRVGFSVGRDIDLEPRQQGPPLNFFIYPYVEVDGKALPADKVVRNFSYKDLP